MFYVCDKIGDKYEVSDDGISIADTNFIRAKAKMLGIKLRNQIYYTLP